MSSSRQFKSFIIHLNRAVGRKEQVKDLKRKSPFDVQIINAVDGKKLKKSDIENFYSVFPLISPNYPFPLTKGEIGCFLSHRRAWQQIVDQKLAAGLVFEDDVHIEPTVFNSALKLAKNKIDNYGYIQFQVREIPENSEIIERESNFNLMKPNPILLRCSAQLISQSTALKLLKLTEVFDRPVDTFLQMDWYTKIAITCITPSGVSDRTHETGGSTLSKKQPISRKLSREIKRALYRFQVKRLSASGKKL